MPCSCGYNPCSCIEPVYSYNWYPTANCNPCLPSTVCKKTIPAKCVLFNGPTLANLNLTSPNNIELILNTIDVVIGSIKATALLNNNNESLKNANILLALNNINARLNAIEGGTPKPNYVI